MTAKRGLDAAITYWEQELVIARTGHRKHVCQTVLKVLGKLRGEEIDKEMK